jgi:hypothetical protein
MLDSGAEFLERSRRASMSVSITYHRGQNSAPLEATRGSAITEAVDGDVVLANPSSIDFIVGASDFAAAVGGWGDARAHPVEGDYIVHDGGRFQVGQAGGSLYDWLSGHRRSIRIYTTEVSS